MRIRLKKVIRILSFVILIQVENASSLLEEASHLSRIDPFSKLARTKLIEGSRLDIIFLAAKLLMIWSLLSFSPSGVSFRPDFSLLA